MQENPPPAPKSDFDIKGRIKLRKYNMAANKPVVQLDSFIDSPFYNFRTIEIEAKLKEKEKMWDKQRGLDEDDDENDSMHVDDEEHFSTRRSRIPSPVPPASSRRKVSSPPSRTGSTHSSSSRRRGTSSNLLAMSEPHSAHSWSISCATNCGGLFAFGLCIHPFRLCDSPFEFRTLRNSRSRLEGNGHACATKESEGT